MRQTEYRLEKNTYKSNKYIQKLDKKYKEKNPCNFRFHIYVKLQIICIKNKIATVIYENKEQEIVLQNMDAHFYLNEFRKQNMEKQLQSYDSFDS